MRRSAGIRYVVAVLFSLVLLGWFLAGIDWAEFREALSRVSFGWVLLSALLMLADYALRGWRWYYLLGDADKDIRVRDLVTATNIGAAFNTFLPLRGGDLVRVAFVARLRHKPFATVLSTTVVERLFELIGIVGALMVLLLLLPDDLGGELVASLRSWGTYMGAGTLVLLAVIVFLGTRGARNAVVWATKPLPARVRRQVLQGYRHMVIGLAAVGRPLRLVYALLVTALIYLVGYAAILCIFRAFELDLPSIAALFAMVAMNLSVALPQAPGFLGVFQVVMEQSMALWGAGTGEAQAMAMVLWAVYFLPVTLVGTFQTWWEGKGLVEFRREVTAEPPDETVGSPGSDAGEGA